MTVGSTPISLPILCAQIGQSTKPYLFLDGVDLRLPVLDDCLRRVDDGAVHVEQEAIEGEFLGRQAILRL